MNYTGFYMYCNNDKEALCFSTGYAEGYEAALRDYENAKKEREEKPFVVGEIVKLNSGNIGVVVDNSDSFPVVLTNERKIVRASDDVEVIGHTNYAEILLNVLDDIKESQK